MRYLALVFIIFSACEIGLLALSSHLIGIWPTIGLIILTGVIGASLAKKQGAEAIKLAQIQIQNGDVPSEAILDGISVLIGAVMLITPGFLSDTCGFMLLIPWTRVFLKVGMRRWLRTKIRQGSLRFFTHKN